MLPLLLAVALLQQTDAPSAPAPAAPPPAAAKAPATTAPAAKPKSAKPERRIQEDSGAEEPVLKGFDRPSGKRFTGEFDDTPVDEALRAIAKSAELSIVIPRGHRHERVSADFRNAAVEDALRAVLQQGGLVAELQGTVISVREPGPFSGLAALGRGIGREAERRANEAMREADREMRRAEREAERAERRDGRARGHDRDRVVRGDVVIRAGETVQDVVAIRGSVKLDPGAEARDVVAILGSVTLEPGARARDAVAVGGDLHVRAGAQIDGDAVSVGGDVHADPSAEIRGETTSVGIPALSGLAGLVGSRSLFGKPSSPLWAIGQVLAKFVVYFVIGLLLFTLFPRRIDSVAAGFAAHPWKSILTGLLGLVLAPILVVLLAVTIIGIPLVPVAALLVVAAAVFGFTALAMYVGRRLPLTVSRNAQMLQLALGTAIVVAVTSIPFLGWMAWVAAALLVFGAVLRTRFGTQAPALATTLPPPAAPPPSPPPPAATP